jgi:hypothetical protein
MAEQRWQFVVRAPSERRASGEGFRGSPSCGTSRWQNWQRMSLPGQSDVRCDASAGRDGATNGHAGQGRSI